MKLKGVNPAEQHVEKIVLGVVALVLLGVLTMQFAIPPKGVSVGNREVPPDKALDPVLDEARRVLAKMNDPEPARPDVSQQELKSVFASRIAQPTVPAKRFAPLGVATNLGTFDAVGEGTDGGMYALPALPAANGPIASAYRGSVHPSEWAASEALRQKLGEDQPFDLGVVTVQAFIDGSAIRTALLTDADGDGGAARPLPPSWWRQGFEILGVQLEREHRMSDGSWGERTIVEGMPGRVDVLGELSQTNTNDPMMLVEMTRLAAAEMDQITKPTFYRTIAGELWRPPAAAITAGSSDNAAVDRLVRQAKALDRDIQKLQAAMEDDGSAGGSTTPGGRAPTGGGGKGRGGGGSSQPASRPSTGDRADPRVARLDRMSEQLGSVELELEGMGYAIDGTKFDTAEIDEDVFGKMAALFSNDKLAMWSHDVTVVGGETYRYRLRPVFNNPAFGRQQALSEDQQTLAESLTFPGPWSAWTEGVQALDDEYYFVVNAREADTLGGGPSASIELYEFYYGYYRRATMTAEPGDQLYAEARVPDGLVLLNTENLKLLDDAEPAVAPPPRGPRGVPDPDGGRGRGRAPGVIEPGITTTRAGQRPSGDQQGEIDPELGEPALRKLQIRVDAVLLDVARVPGSGGQTDGGLVEAPEEFRAFMTSGAAGSVSIRLPSLDEASAVYQAVEASWRAGQKAAAPEPAETTEPDNRRPPRSDDRNRPPTPAPGGGGGGGGSG